jgi:hypothetical protein
MLDCWSGFAGVNAKVLKEQLGDQALQNQFAVASQIFNQYVAYDRGGDKGSFLKANFIEASLVVLERAALFRESSVSTRLPLKDIDKMFVDFSKNYSEKIAATFMGNAAPFKVKEKEGTFSVGQGYVELDFQKQLATVRVVYFSENPR